VLKGYDQLLNLVLDEAREYLRGERERERESERERRRRGESGRRRRERAFFVFF